LIENFNAGSTILMPVVVPACPQLSSSLFLIFPKSKNRKKKAQEHKSLKPLCLLPKTKKQRSHKKQVEMIPESTSLMRKIEERTKLTKKK
jgi:hypothetical protein